MDTSTAQSVYVDYLKKEGYLPEVTAGGAIAFKVEGMRYAILVDAEDPVFFRMLLPNFYRAVDDAARRDALTICNRVTSSIKVAKLLMSDDGRVSASAELFAQSPEEVTKVIARCISALQAAMQQYAKLVNGG